MRAAWAGLVFLAACQAEQAPGVIGGIDLASPVRALGTEPFWGVEITPQDLILTGVDRPEERFVNPGARIDGQTAVIAAEGLTLTLTLKVAACSDGMSDRTYRLEAEVKVGAEVLTGCAESQAVLDAGPRP